MLHHGKKFKELFDYLVRSLFGQEMAAIYGPPPPPGRPFPPSREHIQAAACLPAGPLCRVATPKNQHRAIEGLPLVRFVMDQVKLNCAVVGNNLDTFGIDCAHVSISTRNDKQPSAGCPCDRHRH